jgi:hypothetical protein
MARIFKDSSVLNQFGSPSINSNTFANRPAAGQSGRLFVSTDTLVLYRDNGSIWQVVSATGSTQNLEQTTTNGNTTTKGIFAGATGSLTSGFLLEVLGRTKFTATSGNTVYIGLPNISPNSATFDVFGYSSFRLFTDAASNIGSIMRNDFLINVTTNITTGDPSASINQLTLNCNFIASLGNATPGQMWIGAGLNKNILTDDGSAVSTVTMVQSAGIFALTPLQSISEYSGTGSTTFTHYAGLIINGIKATAGNAINITNNYQLLINSSQQFSGSTTVINRWGIYQGGTNDINYLNANTIIGGSSPIDNGNKLQIAGNIVPTASYLYTLGTASLHFTNVFTQTIFNAISPALALTASAGIIAFSTKANTSEIARFENETGNLLLGTTTNVNSVKLKVVGEQEFILTVGTGTHTTSGNHLPIWVNGVKYWLALLNPVLP